MRTESIFPVTAMVTAGGEVSQDRDIPGNTMMARAPNRIGKIWRTTAGLLVSLALSVLAFAMFLFSGPASARDLANMKPDEIAALQQRLTDTGCYMGAADGVAGPALEAAVKECPDQRPVLRIETGQHVAAINRIGVDRACRMAVTASDDKTVRVWSLPDGKLLRTLRLPIGSGSNGRVYAVALSPDGSTAAAGGWDAYYEQHGKIAVTLFDPATGENLRRIGSFGSVITQLAFSPDGTRLAVALGGKQGVYVLDVGTGREIMADTDFADYSLGLSFGPDGSLYATGYDGFLRRYGPNLTRTAKVKTSQARPYGVAIDPTGTHLAVGYLDRPQIDLFDAATLKLTGSADTRDVGKGDLENVAWTLAGRLMAGGRFQKQVNGQWMRMARTFDARGRRLGADAAVSVNTIMDLQPCGADLAFAAYDPSFGLLSAKGPVKILGQGRTADVRDMGKAFTASDDGTKISFGLGQGSRRPVRFDLAAGTLDDGAGNGGDMHPADVAGLPVDGWQNTYAPKLNGKPLALAQYETSRSLAVQPDHAGFVLGGDYALRGFDAAGTQRWQQPGPGVAWGVNLAQDGALAVAAYGDGTIRWHRWSDGRELLALFVDAPTKRWVAWTPTGYYMASPGAEDLIGWHINRGWAQPADFFPASRFREKFNRPDIVQIILRTLDEGEAVRLANAASHKHEDARPLIAKLPPVLRITTPAAGSGFGDGAVEIGYALRSPSGLPVDRIDVLVDGVRQQDRGFNRLEQPGFSGESRGSLAVHLPAHDVDLALVVHSGDLTGEPAKIRLTYAGPAARDADVLKPKLYALVAGVSDYADPSLRLGYAGKDARDFAEALKGQSGGLYGSVEVKLITDREATRASLIVGLKWLQKQVTSRDVGIVFLAGHGVTDDQQSYWFLPSDATPETLDVTAVSQDDIKRALNGLAGKALLFLDSCHAGQLSSDGVKRRGALDINKVVGDFAAADNGVVVFASSKGREVSQERDTWGNGAFTKALIEGIVQGKADLLHHDTITLSELDAFVADRVKDLTDGAQHPVMTKPSTVPDYPIALFRK